MDDPDIAARRAASRSRWLAELETAIESCSALERALSGLGEESAAAATLRRDIDAAKVEIDRVRRSRPQREKAGDRPPILDGLATWRGNRID